MKEKMKYRKGITLIALVITIIVLLILAGITINLTIGEDGIIKRAEEAGKTYKNAEANELADLASFEASIIAGKVAKTVGGVQYVGDGMGNLIPVPVGFSYLEGTKSTGFVIKNDKDGNEFVWVPCTTDATNGTIEYDRIAWTGNSTAQITDGIDTTTNSTKIKYNSSSSYYYTETMPSDEEASVKVYGGFYIGRYEAGVTGHDINASINPDGTTQWTAYSNGQLVIQKGQQVWNYITRDKSIEVAKELYSKTKGDSVNSKLCSSYAWDMTLKFIQTKYPMYPTNSTQGNYLDKSDILRKPAKTGQTEALNNIYDMGGNAMEWTTEECSYEERTCTPRGGNCNDSSSLYPAASRGYYSKTTAHKNLSFRTTLYL